VSQVSGQVHFLEAEPGAVPAPNIPNIVKIHMDDPISAAVNSDFPVADDNCAKTEDGTCVRRVLIVDDDAELGELLGEYLANEGFTLEFAYDGNAGLRRALAGRYALVVLDVMLPGLNGFEVLRQLRMQSSVPVLMLTARGDDVDRIVGLEIGADDYLPKPFNPRELVARVNAVLRRMPSKAETAAQGNDSVVVGDVELDSRARMVRRSGEIIELTTAEFDLLRVLLQQAGRVVPREQLFQDVLGREFAVFDRSIDNHVSSLRRKLGPRVNGVDRIKSVRNVGYQYAIVTDSV
jgi:DNA-binding response OmpR family regulator